MRHHFDPAKNEWSAVEVKAWVATEPYAIGSSARVFQAIHPGLLYGSCAPPDSIAALLSRPFGLGRCFVRAGSYVSGSDGMFVHQVIENLRGNDVEILLGREARVGAGGSLLAAFDRVHVQLLAQGFASSFNAALAGPRAAGGTSAPSAVGSQIARAPAPGNGEPAGRAGRGGWASDSWAVPLLESEGPADGGGRGRRAAEPDRPPTFARPKSPGTYHLAFGRKVREEWTRSVEARRALHADVPLRPPATDDGGDEDAEEGRGGPDADAISFVPMHVLEIPPLPRSSPLLARGGGRDCVHVSVLTGRIVASFLRKPRVREPPRPEHRGYLSAAPPEKAALHVKRVPPPLPSTLLNPCLP